MIIFTHQLAAIKVSLRSWLFNEILWQPLKEGDFKIHSESITSAKTHKARNLSNSHLKSCDHWINQSKYWKFSNIVRYHEMYSNNSIYNNSTEKKTLPSFKHLPIDLWLHSEQVWTCLGYGKGKGWDRAEGTRVVRGGLVFPMWVGEIGFWDGVLILIRGLWWVRVFPRKTN